MNRIIILAIIATIILSCHKTMPGSSKSVGGLDSVVVDTTLYGVPFMGGIPWVETFSLTRPVYPADSIVISSTVTAHYSDTTTRTDNIEPGYGIDNSASFTQKDFNNQVVLRYYVAKVDLTDWVSGGSMYFTYLVGLTNAANDTILFRIIYYKHRN